MLTDQTAVITGGAQGIGLAIATRFADNGARIVIGDLDEAKAKEAAASLNTDAIGVGCDVASDADVVGLLDAATAAFGSVNVMVNNAGITRDATMRKMTEQQFDDVDHRPSARLLERHPPRRGNHARNGGGLDHQHVVDLRQGRLHRADQLLGGQGRHRRTVQGGRQRGCPPWRPGQRDPARSDPHRHDRSDASRMCGSRSLPRSPWGARASPTKSPPSRCSTPRTCLPT